MSLGMCVFVDQRSSVLQAVLMGTEGSMHPATSHPANQ